MLRHKGHAIIAAETITPMNAARLRAHVTSVDLLTTYSVTVHGSITGAIGLHSNSSKHPNRISKQCRIKLDNPSNSIKKQGSHLETRIPILLNKIEMGSKQGKTKHIIGHDSKDMPTISTKWTQKQQAMWLKVNFSSME